MIRTSLFRQLIGFPIAGLRSGKINGVTVSRNPLAWIPYLLILPVVFIIYPLIMLIVYPIIIVSSNISARAFARKRVSFSDAGVAFAHAYRRVTFPWNCIREVVRHREPAAIFFRILTDMETAPSDGFVAVTDEDDEFQRLLTTRNIPLRHDDFRNPENV